MQTNGFVCVDNDCSERVFTMCSLHSYARIIQYSIWLYLQRSVVIHGALLLFGLVLVICSDTSYGGIFKVAAIM